MIKALSITLASIARPLPRLRRASFGSSAARHRLCQDSSTHALRVMGEAHVKGLQGRGLDRCQFRDMA